MSYSIKALSISDLCLVLVIPQLRDLPHLNPSSLQLTPDQASTALQLSPEPPGISKSSTSRLRADLRATNFKALREEPDSPVSDN